MKTRLLSFALLLSFITVYGCSINDTDTKTKLKNSTENTASSNTIENTRSANTQTANSDHKSTQEKPAETNSDKPAASPKGQLFENMGNYELKVTTSSPEAQAYFNQGLTWMYAFNHDEAIRSFKKAAKLDPDCAMAWWGVSLCEGPNYNDSELTDERFAAAWVALQKATERIEKTTASERDLIEALSHRYTKPWPKDRSNLDQAFADAMAKVWEKHPKDTVVGSLYAESMMDLMPWKLYTLDYKPTKNTEKIVAVLERVMELEPNHPGANHLYIHAVEPSDNPDRGLVSAERLSDMIPASGHLLHMPSHIHVKTGLWDQAMIQNAKAIAADTKYLKLSPKQGMQYGYMVHNAHMLAYAAMMCGREKEAMQAARAMWKIVPDKALKDVGPGIDNWMCSIFDVQKRFGRWDDILAEDPPPTILPVTTAKWRAARVVAYAAKKDFDNAKKEYDEFLKVKFSIPEDRKAGSDSAHTILEVSDLFLAGEIALQKGEWRKAAELLEKSAKIEDTLSYGEPPQWLQPVRHTLGAVYIKDGNFKEAERVYREDLAKWRNNGWSLFGLSRALEEQGKTREAKEVMEKHKKIWAKADAPISTSCKCIPKT